MGGQSSQQQQSTQQSQTTPYAPASAGLQSLLAGLNPSIANLNGGPQVQSALSDILTQANSSNPFGANSTTAANTLLGGAGNYGTSNGILTNAYGNTTAGLSPYTSGSALNPATNPALASELNTVNQQVQNTVNPVFSAAGRLGSPANAQAIGQGIALGDTGILQNAAGNQLNALGLAQNAGNSTASGLTSNDVANAGILGSGINSASSAYGNSFLGPLLALQTAMQGNQLPIQNAQSLAGILGGLGSAFGQTNSTGQSNGTAQESGAQQFGQIAGGIGNIGKFLFG